MHKVIAALIVFCITAVTAAAVDVSSIPNRTRQIQPGEWILLQDTSGESTDTNKITVLDRNGDIIKLRREHYDDNGVLINSTESEMDLAKYDQRANDIKAKAIGVTEEFMMIGDTGHEVYGLLWENADKNTGEKHQYKVLVSPDLPIAGVARFWTSNPNSPTADVIGFGFDAN